MFHMLYVNRHMSCVTFHQSHVLPCLLSKVTLVRNAFISKPQEARTADDGTERQQTGGHHNL